MPDEKDRQLIKLAITTALAIDADVAMDLIDVLIHMGCVSNDVAALITLLAIRSSEVSGKVVVDKRIRDLIEVGNEKAVDIEHVIGQLQKVVEEYENSI